MLREIAGDFTVQVAVTSNFDPGPIAASGSGVASFNSAGILVWAGPHNYLRFESDIWITPDGSAGGYRPLVEHWRANEVARTGAGAVEDYVGRTTHLRLSRKGDKIHLALSHDGDSWIDIGSLASEFPEVVQVGVDAINTSAREFTVTYSDMNVSAAKADAE